MEEQEERVLRTIEEPDSIQRGDFGELLAIRFYSEPPLARKYLVVVYRETSITDGFVLTAYVTRRPSAARETIWRR